MLKRQLATLDALFDHIVADYAAQTNSAIGYSQSERLDVLLRLQHNCTRTARTLSAMDYMAGLSPHDRPDGASATVADDHQKSTPHVKNNEQTKEP